MDLGPYIESLQRDLAAAAETASADVHHAAERLAYAVEPALRIALLEALGVAAAEVTEQLADTVVEVRLRGRDPEFVVTEQSAPQEAAPEPSAPPAPAESEHGMARISLRLPESLKARVEDSAAAAGLSVNAWLVRAVSGSLEGRSADRPPRGRVGSRLTGWQR